MGVFEVPLCHYYGEMGMASQVKHGFSSFSDTILAHYLMDFSGGYDKILYVVSV